MAGFIFLAAYTVFAIYQDIKTSKVGFGHRWNNAVAELKNLYEIYDLDYSIAIRWQEILLSKKYCSELPQKPVIWLFIRASELYYKELENIEPYFYNKNSYRAYCYCQQKLVAYGWISSEQANRNSAYAKTLSIKAEEYKKTHPYR